MPMTATTCPKCGEASKEPFATCPACGIVVAKFQVHNEKPGALKDVLVRFQGRTVAVNCRKPTSYLLATLSNVGEDFFTVHELKSGLGHHFPFSQILSVAEAKDGILRVGDTGMKAPLAITVYMQVIYKGAVSIGIGKFFDAD
jgi:hypothetical protein